MPTSNAQRQAAYRARRPHAGEDGNGERRLNLWSVRAPIWPSNDWLAVTA